MGNPKKGTDTTRAERKAKKRKLEDAIPDLPADNENDHVEDKKTGSGAEEKNKSKKRKRSDDVEEESRENDVSLDKEERKAKKEKREKNLKQEDGAVVVKISKKEKKGKNKDSTSEPSTREEVTEEVKSTADALEQEAPRKSKKERKAERKAKEAAEKVATQPTSIQEPAAETNGDGDAATAGEKKAKKNNRNREKKRKEKVTNGNIEKRESKDPRFIVFIGNLPFSATKESVTKHFASVKPKSVRHLTQKDNPSKSKGIAFVEFDGYDHMKTCLKLFHHSNFDDGISPPRKINVELTAGGGGNTKDRRAKIQEKNTKLNDERLRRIQEEEKAKWEKKREAGGVDESAIHPSRRARVPGA